VDVTETPEYEVTLLVSSVSTRGVETFFDIATQTQPGKQERAAAALGVKISFSPCLLSTDQ